MKRFTDTFVIILVFLCIMTMNKNIYKHDSVPNTEDHAISENTGAVGLTGNRQKLTIEGSTSASNLLEILSEAYMEHNADIRIDIVANGTNSAIKAVSNGTSDLGMISRSLKDSEKNVNIVQRQIAWDALAIIVHPLNPIRGLTKAQITAIYQGRICNWKEAGGEDKPIHVISREEGSGTQEAFKELFEIQEIMAGAQIADGNGSVLAGVAAKPNAMGYISMGFVSNSVKAIEIDSISASRENVINGSYGLKRPFHIIYKKKTCKKTAEAFIDYILSEEGQSLAAKKHIPIKSIAPKE